VEDSVAARRGALAVGLLLGAGVSVALGVYGRVHVPTYEGLPSFGFSSTATFKAWVGSVVLALASAQAVTALWLYGRLPGVTGAPRWLGRVHRTTGFVAFGLSLPVAAYCLYGFGFAPAPLSPRTLVHSIAGCAFYGAYGAKMLGLRMRGLPSWALPVLGGTVMALLVTIWLTAALWFFTRSGLPLT